MDTAPPGLINTITDQQTLISFAVIMLVAFVAMLAVLWFEHD